MKAGIPSKLIALTGFIYVLTSQMTIAQTLYRLEDNKGQTTYTDQITPEKTNYNHEVLNSKGRPIEASKMETKTPEQLLLEHRLEALRKEESKLIAKQKIHDDALLGTYHSKGEVLAALNTRMEAFENQKRSLEDSLKNTKEELKGYIKSAANFEKTGQKTPQIVLDNIKHSQLEIESLKKAIITNDDKQQLTKEEYQSDIQRYEFLTEMSQKKPESISIPSIKDANSLGLFYCDNDNQCAKAWIIARDFINTYSTTEANVFNDKLIMNRPPTKENDISLSLSRIAVTENDYLLFLDILCHKSSVGKAICEGDKVKAIRSAFRPYVNDALAGTR